MVAQDPTQNPPVLAPENYTSLGVTLTASEFIVTLGQTRVVITVGADGSPNPVLVSDLTKAISLAPNVAIGLAKSLTAAIEVYEKNFGKIPTDPKASMSVSEQSLTESAAKA